MPQSGLSCHDDSRISHIDTIERSLVLLQLRLRGLRRTDSPFGPWLAHLGRIGPAQYIAAATFVGLCATLMAPKHALSEKARV